MFVYPNSWLIIDDNGVIVYFVTELPGFYFDPVKNRYFPIKGPIPGSSSTHKNPTPKAPQTPSNKVFIMSVIP